ncbi:MULTISPECIES: RNA polymerase sigma-70 factor [Parabacteroides]|uniref:RNA polymerase sigma-70 factor n=1 Tax=Parabacteroides TaxID=375288 RepID=UPI000F00CA5A|nr:MULTISPECIES: RNA polymerase sigma-70 factor [Parabacteroides]RHU24596.1 RNA polymerase sigma-70 factor [Parabacteroides sp. TM07-1AC]WFE83319.1 RNA polymerase sigma-70 factor [Parabacteroides chongii]
MRIRTPLNNKKDDLIFNIIQGDEKAFRQLFDMYYLRLYHVAIYYLSSKESAEEVVSDVFYTIWNRKETLHEIENIESYLYISTKNQALHYIRRSNTPECSPLDLYNIELIADNTNPESVLLDQEQQELIQKAINSLPEKCREVFRLFLSDKLKQKEIATLLNISQKTVEAHIATAYKKIHAYLKKRY